MELDPLGAATSTTTPDRPTAVDLRGAGGGAAERRAHRGPRVRRNGGNPGWSRHGWPVLRDTPRRRVVLRHAGWPVRVVRHGELPAAGGVARSRLGRLDPPHAGLDGLLALPARQPGLPRQARRLRRPRLGGAALARSPALQPRCVHLCGSGRDGEPPHQPLLLRSERAGRDGVQRDGGRDVVADRVALRTNLPGGGWRARPGIWPPDPA